MSRPSYNVREISVLLYECKEIPDLKVIADVVQAEARRYPLVDLYIIRLAIRQKKVELIMEGKE